MKLNDLTGEKFGRLTVIGRGENHVFPSGQKQTQWLCKCDCGNSVTVIARNLLSGNTMSCGCLKREMRTKHDKWGTKIYKCWDNMKSRCLNPHATGYENWGGRGISIYEPWIHSFDSFYDYVSKLPGFGKDGLQLDRINNDGNYEPGNLRWATRREQTLNSRNCLNKKAEIKTL